MKKFIIIYVISIYSLFAEVCIRDNGYIYLINVETTGHDCSEESEFELVLNDVIQLTGMDPYKTTVLIREDSPLTSKYEIENNTIIMGIGDRSQFIDSESLMTVLIHEVSHYAFQFYLEENLDFFDGLIDVKEDDLKIIKDFTPYLLSRGEDGSCSSRKCKKAYANILDDYSESELEELMETSLSEKWLMKHPEATKMMPIILKYHELMADIISALYYEYPNVSLLALNDLFSVRENRGCRDFLYDEKTHFFNSSNYSDNYCALAKSRKTIWEKAMKPAIKNKNKTKVIQTLFEIFTDEINIAYKNMKARKYFNDDTATQQLIEKINDEF